MDILLCFLGQNHPRPALRRAKKEAKEIPAIAASQVIHFDLHPEMIAITIKDCQLAVCARGLTLDQRDGGAGGSGDELAVLVGHCHLGDADPPAGPDHTAFGDKLIFYIGAGDKMYVEL